MTYLLEYNKSLVLTIHKRIQIGTNEEYFTALEEVWSEEAIQLKWKVIKQTEFESHAKIIDWHQNHNHVKESTITLKCIHKFVNS